MSRRNVDGAPLHIDDAGARVVGRIDGGEDLRIEPSLGGAPAQFDDENLVVVWRRVGQAARRAVRLELVDQHGLSHPAVAVDDQRGHPRSCADA